MTTDVQWDFHEMLLWSGELRGVPERVAELASQAIRKTAFDIQKDAMVLAPFRTGFLRTSITVDIRDRGLAAEVGPTAHYGAFVEFGTSRMAPRPYMRPASNRHIPLLLRAAEQIGVAAI